MTSNLIGRTVFFILALAPFASAQTSFRLLLTQPTGSLLIQNGSTVTFSGPVGQTQTAQVTATYLGSGQVSVSAPTVFGSTNFAASLKGTQPVVLLPGNSFLFTISYTATSGTPDNGQLSLPFVETTPVDGTTGQKQVQDTITLALQGTAPSFLLNYVLPADQNVVALPSGGTIVLPPTAINTVSQATLNVTNTGSGPGTVTGISITPGAFRLSRLPLFPATVAAGQSVQVLILYQPTSVASDTGQVTVTFDTGSPSTINLQGSGTSSTFVYQSLQTSPPTTVASGDTLTFPGTNVGQTNSISFRILNTGNSTGTINSINVAGQGFQLTNVAPLPQTLAPNASSSFTVTFAPTLPNTFKGSLLINSDSVNLTGVGLGPQLAFSYDIAGTTITLGSGNNSVIFSPVMIGRSSQLSLDVKNTGTLATTISNIGTGQVNGPFTVTGVPALPVTLGPNEDFRLPITFTPNALGFLNGTLLFDNTSVALVGSGTQPPPLPAYTIGGASGTVTPATQPFLNLTLANPYPVAIAGTLSLAVSGNLPGDPSVQFLTGGSSVPFVIPANTTSAVFGTQGTQIGLQTGTVASTITLTPSFATQAGNVGLTPANPLTLALSIAPAPPTLISIQFSNQTANGVTIAVSGFTTTRKLTNGTIQFTPAAGFNMPVSKFTIDVQQIAAFWFQSSASQAFGGQFTITIPFVFQGTPPSGQSILSTIASVSISINNDLGTSNSIQAKVQ